MQTLLDKINRETSAFILVQIFGFAIAIIFALVLNVWSATANSSVAKEAAILAAAFGFMVAGLCDFFIHRGTTYLKMLALGSPERADALYDIHEYEKVKSDHFHSWIVAFCMLSAWVAVTKFVWDGNFTDFTVVKMTSLVMTYSASSILFLLGAQLGSRGWKFLIGKAGYIKDAKSLK